MQVYSMAIDAILHCFILDEELSKKFSAAGPKFTPKYLEPLIEKCNKKWKLIIYLVCLILLIIQFNHTL